MSEQLEQSLIKEVLMYHEYYTTNAKIVKSKIKHTIDVAELVWYE